MKKSIKLKILVIDFCKLKSTSPRFILIKNINFLNKNSINALLKLTEEPSKETYFIFTTSSLLPSSETLESRFFKKKIFLNKSFYKEIVNYYMENNNIENHKYKNEINDTPGDYIRKYFFNIDKDIEKLKKNNENLFYKILSEKLLRKKNYNIEYLKKIKMNLSLKNDFKNLYNKIF